MSKLYYDCPIEAAYMAKNFGVKFNHTYKTRYKIDLGYKKSWATREETSIVGNPKKIFERIMGLGEKQVKPFYIAQVSLSIFEPQEGDLFECPNNEYYLQGKHPNGIEVIKIIQRRGKPFITPKTEHPPTNGE